MSRLRILTPGIEPAVLELPAGRATLGRREENPLCLPDVSVSGRHCELTEADGLLTVLDLGSTNGTFIKGERTGQGTVAPGETFKLGGVELCYEVDAPAASPAPVVSAPPPAPGPAPQPAIEITKPASPKLPSLPKLTAPPAPQPAPAVCASAPAVPKLSPAEALKQALAKSLPASAPPAAPAPVVPPPSNASPPSAPATPDSVKSSASKVDLKFTLGDHKPAAPTAPPPAPAPKPGGSKVVPTGEPSKLSLGGHAKSSAPPAAPPSPASPLVPTSGPSKLSLGGGHQTAPPPVEPASTPVVAATASPPPVAKGGKACKRHPSNAALYVCKRCRELSCDACSPATEISGKSQHFCPVCKNLCLTLEAKAALDAKSLAREGQTFKERLPGVFKYPFNKNGVIFLIVGTIVFVALDFASRFSWKIAILGIGYLFAYMQKIVRSSAEAEDELPGFPEVSEWWAELVRPFLLLAWTFVVSFGPAFGYMIYHAFADTEMSLPVLFPLFALGFLYFPMALLAVAMSSSYLAVNPLVVLPAITQLNLEYVGATAIFFGLVLARYLSETLVRAAVPVPVLPTLIGGFLALYFLACEMRLLGLIYYEHRKKLEWFTH